MDETSEKMSRSQLESHLHGVHGEPTCRQAAWRAGQQGNLGVRSPAVADGAVTLAASGGQVLSQLPPPPPPLKFMLHLNTHMTDPAPNTRTLVRMFQTFL